MFNRLKIPIIVLVFLSAAGLSFFFGYSKTAQPGNSFENGDLNSSGLGLGTTGGFSQTNNVSNSLSQGLTGEIMCIEEGGNAAESTNLCTKGLFVANPTDTALGGTSYELVDSGGAGLDNFSKGERVRIFGTIKAGSSSLGLDATINVTGAERVQ